MEDSRNSSNKNRCFICQEAVDDDASKVCKCQYCHDICLKKYNQQKCNICNEYFKYKQDFENTIFNYPNYNLDNYPNNSNINTYPNNSNINTYPNNSNINTYSNNSNINTYSNNSNIDSNKKLLLFIIKTIVCSVFIYFGMVISIPLWNYISTQKSLNKIIEKYEKCNYQKQQLILTDFKIINPIYELENGYFNIYLNLTYQLNTNFTNDNSSYQTAKYSLCYDMYMDCFGYYNKFPSNFTFQLYYNFCKFEYKEEYNDLCKDIDFFKDVCCYEKIDCDEKSYKDKKDNAYIGTIIDFSLISFFTIFGLYMYYKLFKWSYNNYKMTN